MKNNELKQFQISTGSSSASETVFVGPTPSYLIICFVPATTVNGNLNKSPFAFLRHNVKSIAVTLDGDNTLFRHTTLGSETDLIGYNSLMSITSSKVFGNGISRTKYSENTFLIGVAITPSQLTNRFFPPKSGSLKIELSFEKPTEESLNCIVFGQFQSLLQIDKDLQVYSDSVIV